MRIDPDHLTLQALPISLLQTGARVTFADGTYLEGDPETGYMDIGTEFGSEGLWSLDERGLLDALDDLVKIRRSIAEARE